MKQANSLIHVPVETLQLFMKPRKIAEKPALITFASELCNELRSEQVVVIKWVG